MKIRKTVDVEVCDFCLKGQSWYKCLACGKDFCFDCLEKHGIRYQYAINFSGSMDGYYCKECNLLLTSRINTPLQDDLHYQYKMIETLLKEQKRFYKDFSKRSELHEKKLEKLWDQRKQPKNK